MDVSRDWALKEIKFTCNKDKETSEMLVFAAYRHLSC